MTQKKVKTRINPKNRSIIWGSVLSLAILGLSFSAGKDWGMGGVIVSVAYAILVTIFLAAQVIGFIVVQVKYSASVEAVKFDLLKGEGIEWKKT